MKQHFQQIDILKGLAIVAVLLLHTFTRSELEQSYAVFHIWQAVPIFMTVMGFNLALSYGSKTLQFQHLYTWHYFQKKGLRILVPLLLMYAIALVAGLVSSQFFDRDAYTLGWQNFIGLLPVSGKGNYFITLLLQSVLLLPIIGFCFHLWPRRTTLVLLLLEFAFQYAAYHIRYFDTDRYLYDAAIFRYLSAIALGMWLARTILQPHLVNYALLILAGIGGAVYLYLHQYHGLSLPFIRPEWQAQLAFTFPYAGLLILVSIWAFPQQTENSALGVLSTLGKASYHIFLVQVLYFGLMKDHSQILLNLSLCLALGYVFYKLERKLSRSLF